MLRNATASRPLFRNEYALPREHALEDGTNALQFIVQGTHSPDHVHGRIEAFLEKMGMAVFVHSKGDRGDGCVQEKEVDGQKLEEITCMEQIRTYLTFLRSSAPKIGFVTYWR
ncbi:hypothetical protein COOONC_22201 [Cooperia oncophora]